jgi:patatin-related protein
MEPVPHPDREVRFGLVLYGGVSLAIYIYGVAYEFQRLVRASQGAEVNAWTEVLKAANASATVDIVSGASAGGINGVLLGKALSSGADLRAVRSLWIDEADLGNLLHDAGEQGPRSLLQSARFADLLADGLGEMDRQSLEEPLVSAFDLFIAATRLRPWVREFPTDLGGTIQTSDYRKSFELKFRRKGYNRVDPDAGYTRNDFASALNPMLAEVAQATSAFPVAFEPVEIQIDEENRHLFAADEPPGYFSDGGILHNKPFTETVSTILTRAAEAPVQRWLVSVEPDPEHARAQRPDAPAPEVTEVASKAVVGIPRYQSVAADLGRIEEHRRRVDSATQRLEDIDRALLAQIAERRRDGEELRQWRDGVLAASAYWEERERRLRAAFVARMTAHWPRSTGALVRARVAEIVAELDLALRESDADFERRRIQHLLEMLRPVLKNGRLEGRGERAAKTGKLGLWAQFDRVEDALWRIFENGLVRIEPDDDPSAIRAAAEVAAEELRLELDRVREQTAAVCGRLDELDPEFARRAWPSRFSTVFEWFELWDAQLLTIAELSDAAARDQILLARISPADASYIQKPAAQKLAGDALGHFGGFLKREWRANDVLWGRLDAAETISRMLMHGVESGGSRRVEQQIGHVQKAIVEDELPDVEGDYRHHMENVHDVGAETLADVPMDKRANLSLQASDVLRNMFAGLGEGKGPKVLRSAFGKLAKLLGFLLFFLRWPVRAIWGSDPAWRRGISLAILFVGLWAIAAIVLVILGVIGDSDALWALVAGALAIVAIWSALQARFR